MNLPMIDDTASIDSDDEESQVMARQEKKDTIVRVVMSRDFALTVREEANVKDVINACSGEFLMSETQLPRQQLLNFYPMITYQEDEKECPKGE
jgi:hypothetical protein